MASPSTPTPSPSPPRPSPESSSHFPVLLLGPLTDEAGCGEDFAVFWGEDLACTSQEDSWRMSISIALGSCFFIDRKPLGPFLWELTPILRVGQKKPNFHGPTMAS